MHRLQGWEFDLSILRSSIFLSFQSLKKIDRDWIDLVDLFLKIDSIIFKIESIGRSQKTIDSYVFDSFPPFLCQKIESLPSIFDLFKRLTWSIRSCQSFSRLNRSIDLSITKDDRFDQKTDDRISNPDLLQSLLHMFGNSYYTCALCILHKIWNSSCISVSCTCFAIPPFRCDPCFLFCNASCIHLRFLHLFCNFFCTWASCSTFANPPAHIIPAQHTCFAIPWNWFAMRLAHATIVFVLQFLLHLRFLHIFTLKSVCMTGLYLPGGEWWYKGSPGQGKYVRTLHWL